MAAKDESTFPLHLDRYHLPQPEWTFPNAKINLYAQDSEPDFPPVRQAPAGSPNILLVLLGAIITNSKDALGFFFGPSQSSQEKTAYLAGTKTPGGEA